jgi:hypothetical protein
MSSACLRPFVQAGDVALHAELAAGDADEHLVLDDERRRGATGSLGGVAVLHRPHRLAGLRIERDQVVSAWCRKILPSP